MKTPHALLPKFPTREQVNIDALMSPNKKMDDGTVHEQHAKLRAYFVKTFPDVSFQEFSQWAGPWYQAFLESLDIKAVSHLQRPAFHRQVIFGLYTAYVHSYSNLGLSHFALLDPAENRFFTGLVRPTAAPAVSVKPTKRFLSSPSLPVNFDLRDLNRGFPPIYDQQQCGACWAFSATSAMEITNLIYNKKGDVGELSEGAVVECDDYDLGCNGGWPPNAWAYISENYGLVTRSTYPYPNYISSSVATPSCNQTLWSDKPVLSTDANPVYLSSSSSATDGTATVTETDIMNSVYSGFPVVISIAASSACFQSYRGGLMNCACGNSIDHNLLLVGFNATTFTLRNQWNTYWGDKGYATIPRTGNSLMNPLPDGGQCGMYLWDPMVLENVFTATSSPTSAPTSPTTARPTHSPSSRPSHSPTKSHPSKSPSTSHPSKSPVTKSPTRSPLTSKPSASPTARPATTYAPTSVPSAAPVTRGPTQSPIAVFPTASPYSSLPSASPSTQNPSLSPTLTPTGPTTNLPTFSPTLPSQSPTTAIPTNVPSTLPSNSPQSSHPTTSPTLRPSHLPTLRPTTTNLPTQRPTSAFPTVRPTTSAPSTTSNPSAHPSTTHAPTYRPTYNPSHHPSTVSPTTKTPSGSPSSTLPTRSPTGAPTKKPTSGKPTSRPTTWTPTRLPTKSPSHRPTLSPTGKPTLRPTPPTTFVPTKLPTKLPTFLPSHLPTKLPTLRPTPPTTFRPTHLPTKSPSKRPSHLPTVLPTHLPSHLPTLHPTHMPSKSPSKRPHT